ncbi:MAG: DinB family protein [Actinoplanes sp.]
MAQYGPHRWAGDGQSENLSGKRVAVADLAGARFVDCDLTGVKIVDSWLVGVDISGFIGGLTVNGVEVTGYVQAELDRRHPERVQLREMRTADDYRAMWATVERLWAGALNRAERLDEPVRRVRVDGEWSFAETLRHLIFIADSWAARTVLAEPAPFHRLGLPQTAYPPEDAAALGIGLAAEPSWTEVLKVRAERMGLVRGLIDGLTDDELTRPVTRSPAPGYPDEERTVGGCLEVVMDEECEHYRFATRDLAVLEAGPPQR